MDSIKLDVEVDRINQQLIDEFGIDTASSQPMFRVVWNTDQYEKVLGTFNDFTPGGLYIRTVTEERIVPKYRGFPKDRYVLERLVAVPKQQQDQLLGLKTSFEGIWTFSDKNGNFLPPRYIACKFVIDAVLAAQAHMSKMVDPTVKRHHSLSQYLPEDENSSEGIIQKRKEQVNEIVDALAGEESRFGGATTKAGTDTIIMPANYDKIN